ncbi:MAG: NAD(P)H-dependent oxidoreductase [Bacteroidota bacterium]
MPKILAFSGSPSSGSINQQLVSIAASYVQQAEVEVFSLRDYPAPLYSADVEQADGPPATMTALHELFGTADGFILSCPEYNGSMPAMFKNTVDWLSRIGRKPFGEHPMLLMATSPGGRGGKTNLGHLESIMPWWGGAVNGTFSLPSFQDHVQDGVLAAEPAADLKAKVAALEAAVLAQRS